MNLFKKNSLPKGYPSLDQLSAFAYVIARTGCAYSYNADKFLLSGPQYLPRNIIKSKYYEYAIYHNDNTKNPVKRIGNALNKFKTSNRILNDEHHSLNHRQIIGVDYTKAIKWFMSVVSEEYVIDDIFTHRKHAASRCDCSNKAVIVTQELGGAESIQNTIQDGVIIADFEDIDYKGKKWPKFHLAEKQDYNPAEISQLVQCWFTGFAERVRMELEFVGASVHAKTQTHKIAEVVGNNHQKVEYPEINTGFNEDILRLES